MTYLQCTSCTPNIGLKLHLIRRWYPINHQPYSVVPRRVMCIGMYSFTTSIKYMMIYDTCIGGHRLMAPVKVDSYATNTEKQHSKRTVFFTCFFCTTKMANRGLWHVLESCSPTSKPIDWAPPITLDISGWIPMIHEPDDSPNFIPVTWRREDLLKKSPL